jgi:hypothetical protein
MENKSETQLRKAGKVKTPNALSGVAYAEDQRDFRSLKCPEVMPKLSDNGLQLRMPPSPLRPCLFKFSDVREGRAEVHLWIRQFSFFGLSSRG